MRSGKGRVASILSFVPKGAFDDATLRVVGQAFDAACEECHDDRQPRIVQEVMALRIIAAAHRGERNVTRLHDIALAALEHTRARR